MELVRLEDVIRRYIHLQATPTKKGWFQVLCKVCNDHGRKGLRAGFKFEGDAVAYHCFNCGKGMDTRFDPTTMLDMPTRMVRVLAAFGVPESEWQPVLFTALQLQHDGVKHEEIKRPVSIEPMALPIPEPFYMLRDAAPNDKWAIIARDYLEVNRSVDPDSYPFMLCNPTDVPHLKKWFGRVIIPIFKGERLIFYIGRDLTGNKLKKYESPAVSRDKILYGFDRLFRDAELPLYIVEGWFDAFAIDGVALIGNEISDSQIEWLNRSQRMKVYIPDRFGNGRIAADTALEQGWHVATPDIGNCKDMSEAVQQYGKLYVMKSLVETTATGFEAKTNLGVFCK